MHMFRIIVIAFATLIRLRLVAKLNKLMSERRAAKANLDWDTYHRLNPLVRRAIRKDTREDISQRVTEAHHCAKTWPSHSSYGHNRWPTESVFRVSGSWNQGRGISVSEVGPRTVANSPAPGECQGSETHPHFSRTAAQDCFLASRQRFKLSDRNTFEDYEGVPQHYRSHATSDYQCQHS